MAYVSSRPDIADIAWGLTDCGKHHLAELGDLTRFASLVDWLQIAVGRCGPILLPLDLWFLLIGFSLAGKRG